jgi:integrase
MSSAAAEALRAILVALEGAVNETAPLAPQVQRKTLLDTGNELLVAKARSGVSPAYLRSFRSSLMRLFGPWLLRCVHSISATELEDRIAELALSAKYRRNYTTDAQVLFRFAVKRGYAVLNVADSLTTPRRQPTEPSLHTPEVVSSVLETARAHDPSIMRMLAIRYFAGVRTEEAIRLSEGDIGERYITVNATKSKTRARRLIVVQPALRDWLSVGGSLPVKQAPTRLANIVKASGVDWPRNVTRHSFCSYHLACFGSAAKTALEAGHSEGMLFAHYRELVTPEDAVRFWAVRPRSSAAIPTQTAREAQL